MKFFHSPSVGGVSLPGRRFTGWAVIYFLAFVAGPILGLALILDIIFFLVFTRFYDSCYGVLCLLA